MAVPIWSSIETPSVTRASGRLSSFRALFYRRVEFSVLGQRRSIMGP